MLKTLLKQAKRGIGRSRRARKPLSETPAIDDHIFMFISGLHRSGTSILHRLLREHPEISGFEDTGVPEDEGQHLQSVFSQAYHHGGPGSFAFDFRSHLDEHSPLATPENRDKLLREWGAYYDLSRKVLLEKSPPNIVRTRFFQHLFPDSRFVCIVRHPIAVALATKKWTDQSINEILLHWHVAHSVMLADLDSVRHHRIVRYEDFVSRPQDTLDEVANLVSIEQFSSRESIADHNEAYFEEWQCAFAVDAGLYEQVMPTTASPMESFGYSMREPFVVDFPEK